MINKVYLTPIETIIDIVVILVVVDNVVVVALFVVADIIMFSYGRIHLKLLKTTLLVATVVDVVDVVIVQLG